MKKYIFISMTIASISGAIQYLYNKTQHLQKQGYEVFVFSAMYGKILVEKFQCYRDLIFPALMYSPSCFSRAEIQKTLDHMKEIIGPVDADTFIESTSIHSGLWGELLAQELSARNFIINLQEKHVYSDAERAFLRFKYSRDELFGIAASSVHDMLPDDNIPIGPDHRIAAFCNNTVEDVPCSFVHSLPKADYTIASIGRLNKDFIPHMIHSLGHLFQANPDKNFSFIFIGGASKSKYEKDIATEFEKFSNVQLTITGVIYPIPVILLKQADLFISAAGSAIISHRCGRPTIKVHPLTGNPIGVFGNEQYGLDGRGMFDERTDITLADLAEQLLFNKLSVSFEDASYNDAYRKKMENEYLRQESLFTSNTAPQEYYAESASVPGLGNKYKAYKLVGHLIGQNGLQKLLSLLRERM